MKSNNYSLSDVRISDATPTYGVEKAIITQVIQQGRTVSPSDKNANNLFAKLTNIAHNLKSTLVTDVRHFL
jgi:hypothetical protein